MEAFHTSILAKYHYTFSNAAEDSVCRHESRLCWLNFSYYFNTFMLSISVKLTLTNQCTLLYSSLLCLWVEKLNKRGIAAPSGHFEECQIVYSSHLLQFSEIGVATFCQVDFISRKSTWQKRLVHYLIFYSYYVFYPRDKWELTGSISVWQKASPMWEWLAVGYRCNN